MMSQQKLGVVVLLQDERWTDAEAAVLWRVEGVPSERVQSTTEE